eukprot:gene12087-5580_t
MKLSQGLDFVHITQDCYYACCSHALTTEKEEIMGLLIGSVETTQQGKNKGIIWDICMLTRVDKRKDRVEISSEQLVSATTKAENITKETGIQSRVVGWYHSHPHISPWPSHVDLNCQGGYQLMEKGFIGLIFSVFNQDSEYKGTIEVHGFQANKNEMNSYEEVPIPVMIIPNFNYPSIGYKRMIELLDILLQEEKTAFLSSVEDKSDLVLLHNSSIYQKNILKIIEYFSVTIKKSIDIELKENLKKIENSKK